MNAIAPVVVTVLGQKVLDENRQIQRIQAPSENFSNYIAPIDYLKNHFAYAEGRLFCISQEEYDTIEQRFKWVDNRGICFVCLPSCFDENKRRWGHVRIHEMPRFFDSSEEMKFLEDNGHSRVEKSDLIGKTSKNILTDPRYCVGHDAFDIDLVNEQNEYFGFTEESQKYEEEAFAH